MTNPDKSRCELLGEYIIESGATVRQTARVYGVSKSTVHKDVTIQLKYINPPLFCEVKKILDKHKEVRHLLGGEATRKKYLAAKVEKC